MLLTMNASVPLADKFHKNTGKMQCRYCQTTETISHILFSSFSNSFWNEVNDNILNKVKSWRSLSPAYCDVIIGLLKEEMDLLNYIIIILGK